MTSINTSVQTRAAPRRAGGRDRRRASHRRAVGRRSAAAGIALLLFACGPSIPSETEAREALAHHQAAIDKLDQALWSAALGTPYAVHGVDLECASTTDAPPPSTPTVDDPVLRDLVAENACIAERIAHHEAHNAATTKIADELAPTIFRGAGVMGGEARLRVGDANFSLGRHAPFPAGQRKGTVAATDGVQVDGKQLGYGLYSDQWSDDSGSYGEPGYHRGIEVRWTHEQGDVTLSVGVLLPVPP